MTYRISAKRVLQSCAILYRLYSGKNEVYLFSRTTPKIAEREIQNEKWMANFFHRLYQQMWENERTVRLFIWHVCLKYTTKDMCWVSKPWDIPFKNILIELVPEFGLDPKDT